MTFTAENFNKLIVTNGTLEQEIHFLKQKEKFLLNLLYGSKSEKVSPEHLELQLGDKPAELTEDEIEEVCEEAKPVRKKRKLKSRSEKLPADIPIEEVVIEPEEVKATPDAYRRIGEEVTEELDITPMRVFKRRIIRPKYVLIENRNTPPVVATAPERIIPNSYASAGLLKYILISKYCDHLPLYRQSQILSQRYKVDISRQTMSDWMFKVSQMLAMIYEALRVEIRNNHYIQADETPVRYQSPGKGKCGKGYLWAYLAPHKGVLYEWHPGRGAACLKKMLSGFHGVMQSDGYVAYQSYVSKFAVANESRIELAACWAHARRKFYEARDESKLAASILREVQKLYRIEKRLREDSALDRTELRQKESAPIMADIKILLLDANGAYLPKSLTKKAINYTLQLWDKLSLFLDHPEVEIDNNLVENSIRPIAIGKKNWLFFGSKSAGQKSAIIYSLIETCRKIDINPDEYLQSVMEQLPTMTNMTAANYTPSMWKQTNTSKV